MEANVAAADATGEDEEEANEGEETEETEDPENEQYYKVDISKYSMIFKVHTKLTVKTTKRGQGAVKLSDKVFNALPWYGLERHLQNRSIEPNIDNLWNALFTEGTSTPLQKLMIKVNENKATTPLNKKLTNFLLLTNYPSNQENSMQQEPTLLTSRTDFEDTSRSYVT
jgi:hypothetical protein